MIFLNLSYQADSSYYFHLLKDFDRVVWLDSGPKSSEQGRFDIISACPSDQIRANRLDNAVKLLGAKLESNNSNSQSHNIKLPFTSGWIGYISYEARHDHFDLQTQNQYRCPVINFAWYDWSLIQDHREKRCYLYFAASCPQSLVLEIQSLFKKNLNSPTKASKSFECSVFRAELEQSSYFSHLETIKQYILNGDCYQVNYTQRFCADFNGSAADAYTLLRKAVPSPFSAFLDLGNEQNILSISPERFIKIEGDKALTQPIKGTAPRETSNSLNPAQSLQKSVKNRAENLMIVDLLRNDFSQLCTPFSVKVPHLFELKSFANVHHLVSTISGTLKANVAHPSFIQACFPGGSITGAPKKRAMEIIQELEPFERGIYCGSIGYFSANGQSDFNIAIRSFYKEGKKMYCWAGGGIVADSDPIEEYEESWHKVQALMNAITNQ